MEPIDWEAKTRELALKWGWTGTEHPRMWVNPKQKNQWRPDYANSIDALIADMPDNWRPNMTRLVSSGEWRVIMNNSEGRLMHDKSFCDASLAHALLLAFLAVE